jgi:phosphoribosylanthranilate isomerase
VLEYQCNNYLFDSFSEKEYGGTGNKFNWDLIPESFLQKAIIAGGVNEDNVELIYKKMNPYGVDILSSLEKYPGKKDENKVKSFLKKTGSLNQC